jgi:hypothetical protein
VDPPSQPGMEAACLIQVASCFSSILSGSRTSRERTSTGSWEPREQVNELPAHHLPAVARATKVLLLVRLEARLHEGRRVPDAVGVSVKVTRPRCRTCSAVGFPRMLTCVSWTSFRQKY